MHEIVPAESKKDRELKEAKKNAVIIYINEKSRIYPRNVGFWKKNLQKLKTPMLNLK